MTGLTGPSQDGRTSLHAADERNAGLIAMAPELDRGALLRAVAGAGEHLDPAGRQVLAAEIAGELARKPPERRYVIWAWSQVAGWERALEPMSRDDASAIVKRTVNDDAMNGQAHPYLVLPEGEKPGTGGE